MIYSVYKQMDYLDSSSERKYVEMVDKYFFNDINSSSYTIEPSFYSLLSAKSVETTDGNMLTVKASTDISDPKFEILIERMINNQSCFLFRNKFWMIAKNKYGQKISKSTVHDQSGFLSYIMIIYPIGEATNASSD